MTDAADAARAAVEAAGAGDAPDATDAPDAPAPRAGGRRRIDRVLADDFVTGLEARSMDEVRAMRRDAEQEEADLSYVRRMLQGRLDIVRAELSRRAGGGPPDDSGGAGSGLVEHLTAVLADTSRGDHGLGRFLTVEPSRLDEHRRAVEQVVADTGVSDVEHRSDDELRAAVARLESYEHAVSETRRQVQQVMDRLTAEVARRYKEGVASVDDLLAER